MRKLFLLFYIVFSIILSAQDGSVDLNFNTGLGPNGYNIMAMGLQTDGKIIVAGDFTSYDGIARKGIARLNSDGSIDQTFNPGSGIVGRVLNIIIQQDGKIIISGDFTQFNNIQKNYIARLNVDGSLDTTFNIAGSGASNVIYSIAQQTDGKILIAGDFGLYNGIARGRVARLNKDGSLDQTFDSGIGSNNYLNSVVLQSDGKVLIGGYTSTYNNIARRTIARLNIDGSLDTSFNPIGSGGNLPIYSMTVQLNGKIIICGGFTSFNNVETGGIARLNTDGTLDTAFIKNNSASANSAVVLPNGKILTNGNFYSTSKFHRLKTDGSADKLFDTVGEVRRMILQPDGKILVCGYFTSFDGVNKKQIVRINGENILSVSDNEKENLQIYPNPVKDILNIKSIEPISGYEIYSLDGRKLTTGNKVNDSKIDVSNLTKGNYLIKFQTKGKEQTTKFIKE
ncbi:T9SS type A sorting domain-containing protein [Epilithonimonas sp. JDS]|uniref:T9SS type A sorting domain-containing protein n=1 Tax=Epilithonimonas sp. JDS TaxID=2902797 RepID=UPI001E41225E|nr:T9SS type A sorting domain-containing protein [Epilithonimonas sp. JDS]MCD9853095.1 T9SS type A sorting domain-containing protein [Epilithonimonas sp. JDS]